MRDVAWALSQALTLIYETWNLIDIHGRAFQKHFPQLRAAALAEGLYNSPSQTHACPTQAKLAGKKITRNNTPKLRMITATLRQNIISVFAKDCKSLPKLTKYTDKTKKYTHLVNRTQFL